MNDKITQFYQANCIIKQRRSPNVAKINNLDDDVNLTSTH